MVEVKFVFGATLNTFAAVATPNFELHITPLDFSCHESTK